MDIRINLTGWRIVRFGFASIFCGLTVYLFAAMLGGLLFKILHDEHPWLARILFCVLVSPLVLGMILCLAVPDRRARSFLACSYLCVIGPTAATAFDLRSNESSYGVYMGCILWAAVPLFALFVRQIACFTSASLLVALCNWFVGLQFIAIMTYAASSVGLHVNITVTQIHAAVSSLLFWSLLVGGRGAVDHILSED